MAAAVIVVVVVLMAVLIHGCEVSQSNSSLKNYAVSVDSLMMASGANGVSLFKDLQSGELSSTTGAQNLQDQLNAVHRKALTELAQAEALSAPGQLASAQAALVQVMKLREIGIGLVDSNIQPAAAASTSTAAAGQIALGMYSLAGSDVDYKSFVVPALDQALSSAGIVVGGTSGIQIYAGQILNDLGWLNSRFVGEKVGADLPASVVNQAVSGVPQGHSLNYVSVDGTELSPTGTNTVAASPAPTFELNFTNGGQTNEFNVGCKVTVVGLSDVGTTTFSETKPGGTYTCDVTLPQPPPSSDYQVTATIEKVPGEKNVANNSVTYTIAFN